MIRIHCPECGTKFECGAADEGKRITCPDCGECFTAGLKTGVKAGSAPPRVPRGHRRRRGEDDDDENEDGDPPRGQRKPKKKAKTSALTVVISGVIFAVVFVGSLFLLGASEYFTRRAARRLADAERGPVNPRPFEFPKPPVEIGGVGGATKIVGSGNNPQFQDQAPDGGFLIGMELGVVNMKSIKAIRPIHLVNGQEVKGAQHGSDLANVVTVKAKPGYAVSSLTVNAGLWIDSMSVSFRRISDGKIDPSDSSQSDFVGGVGGNRSILGGNTAPAIGIIGKSNQKDCTGIGLLIKK